MSEHRLKLRQRFRGKAARYGRPGDKGPKALVRIFRLLREQSRVERIAEIVFVSRLRLNVLEPMALELGGVPRDVGTQGLVRGVACDRAAGGEQGFGMNPALDRELPRQVVDEVTKSKIADRKFRRAFGPGHIRHLARSAVGHAGLP